MVRLGEILILRGEAGEAGHWLSAAARTNSKSVEASFLSGYLRWEAGDLDGARDFYRRALRAAKSDAPVQGVLSEGDRKGATTASGPKAAPPLQSPMGRTLFAEFCARLGARASSDDTRAVTDSELDRAYAPVRAFTRAHAGRRMS
jgi:hypothetical protein